MSWTDPQGYPEITMNPRIVRGEAHWRRTEPTSTDTESSSASPPQVRELSPVRKRAAEALKNQQQVGQRGPDQPRD